MDERKRRIEDLEKNKRENSASLDALLEAFGENLYTRTKGKSVDFEDIARYTAYLNEIAASNAAIAAVEEQDRRFRELEDTIEIKEQEEKERAKELAGIFRRLGKVLLENNEFDDFTAPFREQADAAATKLDSLENRIGELENKNGGNVFSWIGKSAQGLVLRSFLSKAQENQDQLFRNVGERYSRRDTWPQQGDAAVLGAEVEKVREISRAALDELTVLRDEKRAISAGFGIDGSPQKQIQAINNRIAGIREDLRGLYRTFGAQAAEMPDVQLTSERKYFIDSIVTAEDGEIISRAGRLNQSIADDEAAIVKLRAALAIDEEKFKIEKYRRSIEDKKYRIAEFEEEINVLEEGIKKSEACIQEMQKNI